MAAPAMTDLMTLDAQLRPEHTALLVIDIQNDFCAEGGYLHTQRGYQLDFVPAVVGQISFALQAARQLKLPVIWVRSHYDFRYLPESHRVKREHEGCCMEGTWGADFYQLTPLPGETIIDKHHFSGFNGTQLHETLKSLGVRTLMITGVATNVCVDSTLREGFFLGYHIVLLEDCVGSGSAAGHAGTLATVRNNIGHVLTTQTAFDQLAEPVLT